MEQGLDQLWKGLVAFTGLGLAISVYMIMNAQPLIPMASSSPAASAAFATVQGG